MTAPLEDLYKELILDHYKKPRNRAEALADEDVHVHHTNPFCGDELDLRIAVVGELLTDIAFYGDGCSISMASASAMTEAVKGRPLDEALALVDTFRQLVDGEVVEGGLPADRDLKDGVAFQGVAQVRARRKCALLGWQALTDAIETHKRGQHQHSVEHE